MFAVPGLKDRFCVPFLLLWHRLLQTRSEGKQEIRSLCKFLLSCLSSDGQSMNTWIPKLLLSSHNEEPEKMQRGRKNNSVEFRQGWLNLLCLTSFRIYIVHLVTVNHWLGWIKILFHFCYVWTNSTRHSIGLWFWGPVKSKKFEYCLHSHLERLHGNQDSSKSVLISSIHYIWNGNFGFHCWECSDGYPKFMTAGEGCDIDPPGKLIRPEILNSSSWGSNSTGSQPEQTEDCGLRGRSVWFSSWLLRLQTENHPSAEVLHLMKPFTVK